MSKLRHKQTILIALHAISSLTGLCEMFLAAVLVTAYHMDKIPYIHNGIYSLFPLMIGILGLILTVTSFVGIISAMAKSRIGIFVSAVVIGLVVIPQLYCIRIGGDITHYVNDDQFELEKFKMEDHLKKAIQEGDKDALNNFFFIQRDFGCCGVDSEDGYNDWQESLWTLDRNPEHRDSSWSRFLNYEEEDEEFSKGDLPKSCCIDCGQMCRCEPKNFFPDDVKKREKYSMHKVGCIQIIAMIYKREVIQLLDDGFLIFILATVTFQIFQIFFSYLNYRTLSKESFLTMMNKPATRYNQERKIEPDGDTIDNLPLPSVSMLS